MSQRARLVSMETIIGASLVTRRVNIAKDRWTRSAFLARMDWLK